jgi:adenosylcobinamide-GDP ribazoletransferase
VKDFGGALSLLSIIPVPRRWWVDADWQAGRALIWFPLVGWIIGALVYGVYTLSGLIFTPPITAILTLIAWVVLTGALHLDGLIDCCDALCATVSPERRLEIMKDPRAGSFGVIGAGLILLAKFAALISLRSPIMLLIIPMIARLVILYPMLRYPSARAGGMSSSYRQGTRRVWLAAIWLIPLIFYPISLIYLLVAIVIVIAFGAWAARRLGGGLTGDVYGASCELVETVCLMIATV